jgi:hypothetical protein
MTDQPIPRIYQKSVALDDQTVAIVRHVAAERRLGNQGFSLALRQIIQEWYERNSKSAEPKNPIQPNS